MESATVYLERVKDTLEFNVKSFKTKKDANVEDLLKQLPGVEVDEEGNITVNGTEYCFKTILYAKLKL